jgi:hypothetical protein
MEDIKDNTMESKFMNLTLTLLFKELKNMELRNFCLLLDISMMLKTLTTYL